MRKLVNLKYKESRSVTEHLSEFLDLMNQLTNVKIIFDDEV